eukprot:jgi/Tetstr1/459538/TSEL_004903.t1
MVNLFRLAPDHLCFLGLGKDFWRKFLDVLGYVGFRAMKQEDRRKALVLIPNNFGRGLRPSFAVSKKSKGGPGEGDHDREGRYYDDTGSMEDIDVSAEDFMAVFQSMMTEMLGGESIRDMLAGFSRADLAAMPPYPFPKELFPPGKRPPPPPPPPKGRKSPAVMRAVSQLAVLGHMYKRLQGAVWFVTRWGLQNVVTEEDGPERKAQVDALTREGRTRYLADITVYARLAEGNGFVSLLVSNLHSAVCRMIHQMLACGHPLAELWMENLMVFLKAGAKRVLPKNVCETMMRDLLFAQEINRMKAHRLYREPNPNKKTPIRLVGSASAAWEDAVDFKDHLEKLLDDVRRADSDDSRASARPIRAAFCTVWTPERAHTAVGLDLWRVPGGGGGSGGEEALVLLDGPGIRKVAVLMAHADMSSAKAADLGVDAGELLVAGIHARSQNGAGLGVCRRQRCEAMDTVRPGCQVWLSNC